MQKSWDEVLSDLSTFEKTADAARVLIDNAQPELACMMLRETLLRDVNFQGYRPFIEIAKNEALRAYLFSPEYFAGVNAAIRKAIENRLSAEPSTI